jgi:hypothetical protein
MRNLEDYRGFLLTPIWGRHQSGGDILVDVDKDRKPFWGWIGHGFKNCSVNINA